MSKKYKSSDIACMAKAAQRFYQLFGAYPDKIGVNPRYYTERETDCKPHAVRFPALNRTRESFNEWLNGKYDADPLSFTPPTITMQSLPILPYDGVLYDDFILWSAPTGAVKHDDLLDINGNTVKLMIEAKGYRCSFLDGMNITAYQARTIDQFIIASNDMQQTLAISKYSYERPEIIVEEVERALRRFKEAKEKAKKAADPPEHPNCKLAHYVEPEFRKEYKGIFSIDPATEHVTSAHYIIDKDGDIQVMPIVGGFTHDKTIDFDLDTIKEVINTMYPSSEKCNIPAPTKPTAKVVYSFGFDTFEVELEEFDINMSEGEFTFGGSTKHPNMKAVEKKKSMVISGTITLGGETYNLTPATK